MKTETQEGHATPSFEVDPFGIWKPLPRLWLWLLPPLVGALGFVPLQDHDLWWHLAIGREIAQGGWPWFDSFSWTHRGQPLSFVPWLPSLYFYGVWSLAGVAGLVFLQGLHCGLWAWLSLRYHRYAGAAALWTILVFFLAFPLIHSRLILLRSQFVPYLWLAWAAGLGSYLQKHPASRWKWAFVPWMFLWVQSHASFALGLAWIGLVLIWPLLVDPDFRRRFLVPNALVLLASLGVCFLTPSGMHIFSFLSQHASQAPSSYSPQASLFRLTIEIYPFQASAFFGSGATYLGLLLISLPPLVGLSWRTFGGEKIVWLLICSLPFQQQRFLGEVGLFALLLFPRWLTALQAEASLRKAARYAQASASFLWLFVFLWLALVVLRKAENPFFLFTGSYGFSVSQGQYPSNISRFLNKHRPRGKLYNALGSGSFLTWHSPQTPVFIDGRTLILYSNSFFSKTVGSFVLSSESFLSFLEKEKIDIALVQKDRFSRDLFLQKKWQAVAIDERYLLYLRWDRENDALLKKYAYFYLPSVHDSHRGKIAFRTIQMEEDAWKALGVELRRAIQESAYPSPSLSSLWMIYHSLSSQQPSSSPSIKR